MSGFFMPKNKLKIVVANPPNGWFIEDMKNELPQARIGAEVRIKSQDGEECKRGIIAEHVNGKLWGVKLNNEPGIADYSEREMTVMA